MTVAELIELLRQFPPDAEVYVPEEGSFCVEAEPRPTLDENGKVSM
jgi:hypothetical protein